MQSWCNHKSNRAVEAVTIGPGAVQPRGKRREGTDKARLKLLWEAYLFDRNFQGRGGAHP
ncbi:protein of unknown function [Ruminococcaceae bacterium BL-6]|nr:protein of unknown function [Ruminococcaceae bacterium BL-6]